MRVNLSPLAERKLPWQEVILGGQKSGKTRRAEQLAADWLGSSSGYKAIYVATGQAWDAEMAARIDRHQRDRLQRVPGIQTLEEPRYLSQVLHTYSDSHTLIVIDCLTLWLTNWMMPAETDPHINSESNALRDWVQERSRFLDALQSAQGPVVLVGNEIGMGVIPLGGEVRAFVDALGTLNQDVARVCTHATLAVAGLAMVLK